MENKYNATVKLNDGVWITYHKIHSLKKFVLMLDEKFNGSNIKGQKWRFCNIYNRETGDKLGSYLNGDNPTRPLSAFEL